MTDRMKDAYVKFRVGTLELSFIPTREQLKQLVDYYHAFLEEEIDKVFGVAKNA